MRHPLSQKTMEDVRQCFMLIAAREKEISELLGKPSQHRGAMRHALVSRHPHRAGNTLRRFHRSDINLFHGA
jgi:peptide subunit release factor 1 (eRF1)